MAIVPLKKVTFYGALSQKEAVLQGLQRLGCLHLLDLRPEVEKRRAGAGVSADAYEALKYLVACPVRRRPLRDPSDFDFDRVHREALEIQRQEVQVGDERDQLLRAIRDLQPWGEFQLPEGGRLEGLRFWFYVIPHYQLAALEARKLVWQSVTRSSRFDYLVVFAADEPPEMPVAPVQLDARPMSELRRRLEAAEVALEDLHWQRVALTRWTFLLSQELAAAEDQDARRRATQQTLDASPLFALQGWAPRGTLAEVRAFSESQGLALTERDPSPDDQPPTLLENPERLAGGEEAVKFYLTPGYRTWDPSLVAFVSFCLFFAMIFADAGYGLLLGLVVLLSWRRVGRWPGGTRLRNLMAALVVASVAYGALVGTYFGVRPAGDAWLARLHVLDAQNLQTMMFLSIAIGVLHLSLGSLALAWLERRTLRVFSSLGWCAILLGGLSVGSGVGGIGPREPLVFAGSLFVAAGAAGVFCFSSRRPWRTVGDWLGRVADGLKSLAGVTQAFGDALSYLRLFALGLATTQLAVTFNELAGNAAAQEGLGVLLALLIIVVGHGLNFALATLSGVVHGLRLVYVEFFKWALSEEGVPFVPFAKKAES